MSNTADIERLLAQQKNEIQVLMNQLKEDLKTELAQQKNEIQVLVNQLKEDLKTELMVDIENIVQPIRNDVADVKNDVADLKNDVALVNNKVVILDAKSQNSCAARDDRLRIVPKRDGLAPEGDYPETLMHLLVAGNETLPNGHPNNWNKRKSHRLLRQYVEDVDDVSDNENEYSERARNARLRLARALGVTRTQLNYAQLSL